MRRKSPGLFTGWWFTLAGDRLAKIRQEEFGELYRLERLGRTLGLHRPGFGAGERRQPQEPCLGIAEEGPTCDGTPTSRGLGGVKEPASTDAPQLQVVGL
jgi:hypothetical protein